MEFNSLVQLTFEKIIYHKRFAQYCIILTYNDDFQLRWNFLMFKEFHPLNNPGEYVQKNKKKYVT